MHITSLELTTLLPEAKPLTKNYLGEFSLKTIAKVLDRPTRKLAGVTLLPDQSILSIYPSEWRKAILYLEASKERKSREAAIITLTRLAFQVANRQTHVDMQMRYTGELELSENMIHITDPDCLPKPKRTKKRQFTTVLTSGILARRNNEVAGMRTQSHCLGESLELSLMRLCQATDQKESELYSLLAASHGMTENELFKAHYHCFRADTPLKISNNLLAYSREEIH